MLVVHASVGSGHRSAANAIAEAFNAMKSEGDSAVPNDIEVKVLDILDFGRIIFDGNKTASMFTGVTRPYYDITWRYTLTGRLLWGGGTIWAHIMYPKFVEYVRETQPIAIIATHITAANVAVSARMLTGQDFPIVCVPTDYEVEGLWPHISTNLFCVATEAMAETLRPRKVPEKNILITGIPTREAFRKTYDRDAVRSELGLPKDKLLVLALAGAYLPQPYVNFRASLDKLIPYLHLMNEKLHFVFIAGKDAEYAHHLRSSLKDLHVENATVFEYVDDMAALMASSDAVICKSGGLTVTECLCAKVPMILMGRAYGQEKINVQMLTSLGAAMHVTTSRELLATLMHMAERPESLKAVLLNGNFLRKPNAARDIVNATMKLISEKKDLASPEYRKHFAKFYWGKKPAHIR